LERKRVARKIVRKEVTIVPLAMLLFYWFFWREREKKERGRERKRKTGSWKNRKNGDKNDHNRTQSIFRAVAPKAGRSAARKNIRKRSDSGA